ncbi:S1/P1 nuclease [Bradyrhizobium ivorense]|uniref:S1/P1 nuclease n=1 Tax=Bradyrhizobium ivorense TaxID=2511166 RepID=UPI0010BC839B|nr:S1/P1 nuclease [Bradyrhizobium ivorense]VIO79231.1 hypothetical protein CI41S_67990 [Bradyrhizobium ivorense]
MTRLRLGLAALACGAMFNSSQINPSLAWGPEGHQIVALVAQSFLEPDVRKRVNALLAADTDTLTPHDMASAANWADRYRDANIDNSRVRTRQWHFVDIEISDGNLDSACFNHPAVPGGSPASDGPAADCIADKIEQFAAELADPPTDAEERVVALKFLLHFVGDVHQPLHSSDDQDRGGNDKRVSAAGLSAGNLHDFWDTEFVEPLGTDPKTVASGLIGHITVNQQNEWQSGGPADWAREASHSPRMTPTASSQAPVPTAASG